MPSSTDIFERSQKRNGLCSIIQTDLGITMFDNLEQKEKASNPILETALGRVIFSNLLQLKKHTFRCPPQNRVIESLLNPNS